ncbi:MAG: hypothetical protein FJX65_07675 [Alphaproteobacteria bacterium]|nr:hypothetical protein [Alphaproteobacteria bacterium]
MRALKALVVIMGVLIVVGFSVIATTIVNRMSDSLRAKTYTTTIPGVADVLEMSASGDRVVLRSATPNGARLTVVDTATGRLVGTIDLPRAP